jgi:type III restriction enzyme
MAFNAPYVVQMISDIVINPFVGRQIVERLVNTLKARGFDDYKLGRLTNLVVEELRRGLEFEQTARAEKLFKDEVAAGRIQFRLRLDGRNWCMPFEMETTQPEGAEQLPGNDGAPLKKSIFAPVYKDDFNKDEREVAVYLDGEETMLWWHRNVARSQYSIQGWKRAKIYPDFIFAVQDDGKAERITVLETKGDQLDNLDTAYKREVLEFMSRNFKWDNAMPAGEVELVRNNGETVNCKLILMSEWKTKLPEYL